MSIKASMEYHLDQLEKLLREADNEYLYALPGDKVSARKRRTAINAACNALHKGIRS